MIGLQSEALDLHREAQEFFSVSLFALARLMITFNR